MHNKPAILALADGTIYEGVSIGADGSSVGELVFNTSMTGYQEMLTDPSYAKQILMLTASHVGSTGCNIDDYESNTLWAAGLVVSDCPILPSNYRADASLPQWLNKKGCVAISGVDTRALTHHIREHGAMGACISTEIEDRDLVLKKAQAFCGLQGLDLAQTVSRQSIERWHTGRGEWGDAPIQQKFHVVVYDFGIKHNMLRILHDKGCHLTIVPAKTPAQDVLAMEPDGILLSNGPGDPASCDYAISATQTFLEKGIPVFGICLGFQILALAGGAQTVKMKFGHHGANHPVIELSGNKKVFITSQNHGFMVDESSVPPGMEITHRSLFDKSIQGFKLTTKPAFGFQGHPEASPGPDDLLCLFDRFIELMKYHHNN